MYLFLPAFVINSFYFGDNLVKEIKSQKAWLALNSSKIYLQNKCFIQFNAFKSNLVFLRKIYKFLFTETKKWSTSKGKGKK